jgi:DNA-binding NarL/FixJ family response regulator
MTAQAPSCVLLADRHHGLSDGIRGLLEAAFQVVVMVADETSLIESAKRLQPALAVVDLSLAQSRGAAWLSEIRSANPNLRIILLSVHDEPSVCASAMEAGADGFVVKRDIATELLAAVDAVLGGKQYISSAVLDQLSPEQSARYAARHVGNENTGSEGRSS